MSDRNTPDESDPLATLETSTPPPPDPEAESDALDASLLADPFPSPELPAAAEPRPVQPRLLQPKERWQGQDEVTVVGQGLEELLASQASYQSNAPTLRPAAVIVPQEVTVVGKSLSELLAASSAADSLPRLHPDMPLSAELTPVRPLPAQSPPTRPGAWVPPPKLPPTPAAEEPVKPSRTPLAPRHELPFEALRHNFGSGSDEEDETRILRLPSGFDFRGGEGPFGLAPADGSDLRPESFAPPTAFRDDYEELAGPGTSTTPLPQAPAGQQTLSPPPGASTPAQSRPAFDSMVGAAEGPTTRPPGQRAPDEERPSFAPSEATTGTVVRVSSVPPPAIDENGLTLDPIAREAWIARAEWLEAEAQAVADPQARARTLLIASELWSLVGDVSRAREMAAEAASLARPLTIAARQQRWLAALEADWKSVASSLEIEARSAGTPAARAHAAYFCAEVHRLALNDPATAQKKCELSVWAQEADPRGHLMKLADELSTSAAAPNFEWPTAPALSALSQATEQIVSLRNAQSAEGSPLAACEEAHRALAHGEREEAAHAVLQLRSVKGLEQSSRWLAAALLAPLGQTRARSIAVLDELLSEHTDPAVERALASRALEAGDSAALGRAMAATPNTFSAADRVALATLAGGEAADLSALLADLAASEEGRPLAAAAVLSSSALASVDAPLSDAKAKAAVALGRTILACSGARADLSPLRAALSDFSAAHVEHPLAHLLQLELAVSAKAKSDVATGLAGWPSPAQEPLAVRDRELVAALIYELSAEPALARRAYERALALEPATEVAVRALTAGAAPRDQADLLESLAEAESVGTRAALHFVEAALRRGTEATSGFDERLERAVEAEPKLALPYQLGEQRASSQGDTQRVLHWLRARRPLITDPLEISLELVREALLSLNDEPDAAALLLKDALEARPDDVTLNELNERFAPVDDESRARWRETAAESATPAARHSLLLQAALEYERAQDKQAALRCARKSAESSGGGMADLTFARLALGTEDSAILAEKLLAAAKLSDDVLEQRHLYSELSAVDKARGDISSALLWQSAILERSPRHLPALRELEQVYLATDRRLELEGVEVALSQALTGSDAAAAARLAARLRSGAGNWNLVRPLAEVAIRENADSVWALRALSAQARATADAVTTLEVEQKLLAQSVYPLDAATLALRAAEAAVTLERWGDAQDLLEQALEQVPSHPVALTELARVLERREDYAAAAAILERVAEDSVVDAHKVEAWYHASSLWLYYAEQEERGKEALEQAVALDIDHLEAVARLQGLYVQAGDRHSLAALLERRLEHTTDPEERIAIEVARGRALAEVGEPVAAKAALAAALDSDPDHLEALQAFAELCLAQGDWAGGEQALIRLGRRSTSAEQQAEIYRKLGELYDEALPDPERAELAYLEVLKRSPDDAAAIERLVNVYARMGAADKAVALQTEVLQGAKTAEERRDRTVRLALVLDQLASDRKAAEQLLEKARKEWPHDAAVLRALADLYFRAGESRTAHVLLDRAAADARRALVTGRFESVLFETLATVAELRGAPETAAVAHSTLSALQGDELPVRGAGPSAGDAQLDTLLAPDLLSAALRSLLIKTGQVLDAAYPLDLRSLRAAPLGERARDFGSYVQQLGRAFGFASLELLVSPVVGATCLPATSKPPTLVFGQELLDTDDDAARYCLVIRALKILQGRASTMARTAPIDLWPLTAGLLSVFAPSWTPQGVDARKLAEARARITAELPPRMDEEVTPLALEVSALIGNRASQLATAVYQWGNRCALLAVGDPLAMLRAIAMASGNVSTLPAQGPERLKWIVRNAEARDLAIFSVSEPYADARRRLGLGT